MDPNVLPSLVRASFLRAAGLTQSSSRASMLHQGWEMSLPCCHTSPAVCLLHMWLRDACSLWSHAGTVSREWWENYLPNIRFFHCCPFLFQYSSRSCDLSGNLFVFLLVRCLTFLCHSLCLQIKFMYYHFQNLLRQHLRHHRGVWQLFRKVGSIITLKYVH